jgi:hypothetical protein
MKLKTCVMPEGCFDFRIHCPSFSVRNLRHDDRIAGLGRLPDGETVDNRFNYPLGTIEESAADRIFEVANPFPFRGATFIKQYWAKEKADHPERICLPTAEAFSFSAWIRQWAGQAVDSNRVRQLLLSLPEPVQLTLAATSTDPEDLVRLAEFCCELVLDPVDRKPVGLQYRPFKEGPPRAVISHPALFEVLVNNPSLPDDYKRVMVLQPGVQGGSEIVGEWGRWGDKSHVYEYLRRNSYIPWGHYAANMAEDAVRYRLEDLSAADMTGLRHLYYQRTFIRLADQLEIDVPIERREMTGGELEQLRLQIVSRLTDPEWRGVLAFDRTLWGWNYGFDFAPSRYRLHASHQQIHQQYALIPSDLSSVFGLTAVASDLPQMPVYGAGDPIESFIREYHRQTGRRFFDSYIDAIRSNRRMDGATDKESGLIVYEENGVMVFVPKAQTSQWELQIMLTDSVGNIVEADTKTRAALDRALLVTARTLSALGARMITAIEYAKRIGDRDDDQRLLYALLPKLPESPGAFSEAQLRWINGHFPEDFAAACRRRLPSVLASIDKDQ